MICLQATDAFIHIEDEIDTRHYRGGDNLLTSDSIEHAEIALRTTKLQLDHLPHLQRQVMSQVRVSTNTCSMHTRAHGHVTTLHRCCACRIRYLISLDITWSSLWFDGERLPHNSMSNCKCFLAQHATTQGFQRSHIHNLNKKQQHDHEHKHGWLCCF
jgi:hypothetical protein